MSSIICDSYNSRGVLAMDIWNTIICAIIGHKSTIIKTKVNERIVLCSRCDAFMGHYHIIKKNRSFNNDKESFICIRKCISGYFILLI